MDGDSLFGADVLFFDGLADDLADADLVGDVAELQAQVLPYDGQPGAPLPGACLWKQLGKEKRGKERERKRQTGRERKYSSNM